MQVKDVDTLYSDYIKVRQILRGKALYIRELERLCKEQGIETKTIEELRDLGQIKRKIRLDGIPDNKFILDCEKSSHYAAIGMDSNANFYEQFKIENRLTPENLLDVISQFYGQSKSDIKSKSRKQSLVICRQVFSALLRKYRPHTTLTEIGEFLGGRDHSTVIHALRNNENDLEYRQGYKDEYNKVKQFLIHKL